MIQRQQSVPSSRFKRLQDETRGDQVDAPGHKDAGCESDFDPRGEILPPHIDDAKVDTTCEEEDVCAEQVVISAVFILEDKVKAEDRVSVVA
jgi:hypothetical protein